MRVPASTARKNHVPRPLSRRSFVAGGIISLATVISGCGSRTSGHADPSTMELDLAYPNESLLAGPEWIAARIEDPRLRLLDCSPLQTYRDGHLPGALHVWWQDTIELHNPVYGMLVNAEGRAEIARSAGILPDSMVVCYDDAGGVYASRLLWMLRYMGYRSGRLLSGGRDSWQAAGYELTLADADAPEGGIDDIFDESIIAQPADILARLDESGLVILDTRTASEREETWNNHLRLGAIPGSQWLPRDQFLQPDSVPLPAADLVARLNATFPLGATSEIIVYGLHGTLASLPYHLLLALNRAHVRLYDGSWAQWGANESLPLQNIEGSL